MHLDEIYLIYPEGDQRELNHHLRINQLIDLNGYPLPLPLQSNRIIAYRVYRKSTKESRGTTETYYHAELVPAAELLEYVR